MKYSTKLLIGLFFVFFSTVSQAQNYYVCDNGNDANDGKSESSPFKTFEKGISTFNNMFAGSSVLFCRGGNFPVSTPMRITNSRCGAEKNCTLADYGDPNKPSPQIIVNERATAFSFQNGGASKQDGGYVIKNLTLLGNGVGRNGIFLFNDVDDVLIADMHIEGFEHGIYSGGASSTLEIGSNGVNDRLEIKNNTIINNSWQGLLGSCNDCLIENNYFENNGFYRHIKYHNIYMSSGGQEDYEFTNVTIRGNTLYKSAIVDGQCKGVSLVVHGKYRNLTIENNLVKEDLGKVSPYCWGISVDPGYAKEEAFYNVKIINNKLINVGNVAIGCASCDGVLIDSNEIIDAGNVLKYGIKVPVRLEDSVKSKNVLIKNNKIIYANRDSYGISVGGEFAAKVDMNEVTRPKESFTNCFLIFSVNAKLDLSTNTCKFHNGIAINDDKDESISSPVEEQIVETENSSSTEDFSNSEESNQAVVEIIEELPEVEVIAKPSIIEQSTDTDVLPNEFVVEIDNSNSTSSVTTGSEININEQPDEFFTPNSVKKSRAGSGASGGGSAKNKKTSTTISDLTETDDIISYDPPQVSGIDNATIMSLESENIDITSGLPKTEPESSKYSVKVKDVMEASRNENQVLDVTQCRAYAAGKCLMK